MPYSYWLFVAITLVVTAVLCYATYRTSQLLAHWKPDRNLLLLPSENLVRVGLILLCIILGLLSGLSYEQLGWTLNNWPHALLEGAAWGLALTVAIYFSTRVVIRFGGEQYYSSTRRGSHVTAFSCRTGLDGTGIGRRGGCRGDAVSKSAAGRLRANCVAGYLAYSHKPNFRLPAPAAGHLGRHRCIGRRRCHGLAVYTDRQYPGADNSTLHHESASDISRTVATEK